MYGVAINIATFIAISTVLVLCLIYAKKTRREIISLGRKMKIWNFSLILLSVIFYATIFGEISRSVFHGVRLGSIILLVVFPFILGFLTGRVQLASAIAIPLALYCLDVFDYGAFAIIFVSALSGYIMSPAHPCLILSVEYFRSSIPKAIKKLIVPSILFVICGSFYGFILRLLIH